MNYEDKKEILSEAIDEYTVYPDIADALVGWVERFGQPPIAVYDYDLAIQCWMEQGMTEEEAEEWYNVNSLGAWVGETTPCFIHQFKSEEEECRFSTVLKNLWTKTVNRITETLRGFGESLRRVGR